MADNFETNAGSGGDTFAADEIASVKYPRTKIVIGADGTNDGDVSDANPMPVDDAGGSLTVDGTVTANLSATDNAVLDNIDTNTDFGQVTGGGTETGALRVTLANNSTGVVSVDDNGSTISVDDGGGSLTVDGTVGVSGTVMVSAASLPLPTGAATSANQSTANGHLSTLAGAVTGTEVQVDVVTSALPAGAATAANQSTGNSSLSTIAGAVTGTEMQVDVVAALPAGTNNIGDVDVASIAAGSNLIGDVGISGARTSGGTTIFRSIDVDETEEEIKSSAGQIYWIHCINLGTAVRYLKFYNATAASVTVGTTTPVLTFPIPDQAASNDGAGFVLSIPNGIAFSTAITVAATTGVADADTGAPGANEVVLNLGYA